MNRDTVSLAERQEWGGREGGTVNLIHRIYCRSGRWRARLSQLLPWLPQGFLSAARPCLSWGAVLV
jgi:hypothetical protein